MHLYHIDKSGELEVGDVLRLKPFKSCSRIPDNIPPYSLKLPDGLSYWGSVLYSHANPLFMKMMLNRT